MSEGKGELVLKADSTTAALSGVIFSQTYTDNIVLSETEYLDSTYVAHAAALPFTNEKNVVIQNYF